MPRGVPVATVSVNNSINAALLAVRILAAADGEVAERMREYQRENRDEVLAKEDATEGLAFEEAIEKLRKK